MYCPFTFVSSGKNISAPEGCTLFADKNLNVLAAGQSSVALYVCSVDRSPVKIDAAQLQSYGMLDSNGNSIISFIEPGPLNSLTWFILDKFSGDSVTYESGWHPSLTDVHMRGSTKGNDAVLSVILRSTATSVSMPSQCSASR
jgi:hypothetical protein